MAGAVVPNDWDGSSFGCLKIVWPLSEQWNSILLGQMTEAAFDSYWDPSTGDVDQAVQAALSAYSQSLQANNYLEACDTVSVFQAFDVELSVQQTIPAGAIPTRVDFDLIINEIGNPDFRTGTSRLRIPDSDPNLLAEWWHFAIILGFSATTGQVIFQVQETAQDDIFWDLKNADGWAGLNCVLRLAAGKSYRIICSSSEQITLPATRRTVWTGHRLFEEFAP